MGTRYGYFGIGVVVEGDKGRVTRIYLDGTVRAGKPLPPIKPDLSTCTYFERMVIAAVMGVPAGKTATYAHIATMAGSPGAARAVGNIMAKNPVPIIVPCHRVIRSDRTLGGFSYGPTMKRRLLEREGVKFQGEKVKKDHVI